MKNVKLDIQRFSHTNSTSNYEFPLFVGTDKPAWLSDVNGFASAADTAIKAAKDRADAAYTLAGTAEGKADLAQGDATSALNSAGSANTNIGTMANLNTTEKSSLVGAINEVNNRLNFTSFKRFSPDNNDYILPSNDLHIGGNNISIAKTNDGSYIKVYGQCGIFTDANKSSDQIITITNTGIGTIPEQIVISTLGVCIVSDSSGVSSIFRSDLTIKTNGDISFNTGTPLTGKNYTTLFFPCVIQVKSFGDQPE